MAEMERAEFGEFAVGELFKIYTGGDFIIGRTQEGEIPLISHQHDNNGITKFVQQVDGKKIYDYTKTISLADRGVFYATTQAYDFYIGTRVKALEFTDGTKTREQRLFTVASINKLQPFFTEYSSNATDKLPNLKIQLPTTTDGNPNFPLMQAYIKAVEKQVVAGLVAWLAEKA